MAMSLLIKNAPKLRGSLMLPSVCIKNTSALNNIRNLGTICAKNSQKGLLLPKITAIIKPNALVKRSMSGESHAHDTLWKIERIFAVLLLGLTPAVFIKPGLLMDNAFAIVMVMHFHWGLEAITMDYIRPVLFGPVIPKVAVTTVYVFSALTLGSLLYYNYKNIGIGRTFNKLWAVKH